jgi:hypothetical protein
MRRQEVMNGLKYITESPMLKFGGFHQNTIQLAKAALDIIEAQEASTNSQSNAMALLVELSQAWDGGNSRSKDMKLLGIFDRVRDFIECH